MMKQNRLLIKQFHQNKELRLLSVLEVYLAILLLIPSQLGNAQLENQTIKSILRIRNSEVLINKKLSSQEVTLRLLLD
jgi:hypothetical protein